VLHVYVKIRITFSGTDHNEQVYPEVWGLLLAPPDSARQHGPNRWTFEEDGMRFELHGPVPVPGT
jgi:hypothetical protein